MLETRLREVDKQSDRQPSSLEVRDQLRLVRVNELLHSFELDDHLLIHDQVEHMITKGVSLVGLTNASLRFEGNIPLPQLDLHPTLVHCLEKSRTEFPMHFHRCTDNFEGHVTVQKVRHRNPNPFSPLDVLFPE